MTEIGAMSTLEIFPSRASRLCVPWWDRVSRRTILVEPLRSLSSEPSFGGQAERQRTEVCGGWPAYRDSPRLLGTSWPGRGHFLPVATRIQVRSKTSREMSRERFVAFVGTAGVI